MRRLLLLIGICGALLQAQEFRLIQQSTSYRNVQQTTPYKNLWRTSIASLAVANALDVQSSWGKHELNSTLAGPSGTFGKQGALLKLGFQGGLIGVEYLITRGHPTGKLYRALSFINFGAAAAIGSVAAHNYTVPR